MGTRDDARHVSVTIAGVLLLVVAVVELLAIGYYVTTHKVGPLLAAGSSSDLALAYAIIGCVVLFRYRHWRFWAGVAGGLLLLFGIQNLLDELAHPGNVWPFPITLPLLSLLVGLFVLFVKRQSSSKDAVSSAGIALIVLGVAVLRFFGDSAEVEAVGAARGLTTLPSGPAWSANLLLVIAGAAIFIAGLTTAPWWLRLQSLASSIIWSVVTLTGALVYLCGRYWLQCAFLPTTTQTSLLSGGPDKLVLIGAVVSAILILCGVATAQRWRTWRLLTALIAWTLVVFGGLGVVMTAPQMITRGDTFMAQFLYIFGVGVFVLWARRQPQS